MCLNVIEKIVRVLTNIYSCDPWPDETQNRWTFASWIITCSTLSKLKYIKRWKYWKCNLPFILIYYYYYSNSHLYYINKYYCLNWSFVIYDLVEKYQPCFLLINFDLHFSSLTGRYLLINVCKYPSSHFHHFCFLKYPGLSFNSYWTSNYHLWHIIVFLSLSFFLEHEYLFKLVL